MTSFIWSHGHIGWPLFAVIAFSVVCLLATDVVWRANRTRFRHLAVATGAAWAAGVIVIGVLSFV